MAFRTFLDDFAGRPLFPGPDLASGKRGPTSAHAASESSWRAGSWPVSSTGSSPSISASAARPESVMSAAPSTHASPNATSRQGPTSSGPTADVDFSDRA
jgi:hypothetical protein